MSPEEFVQPFPKPFLGGFRDRIRKTEYHHAIAQTAPPPRPKKLNAQNRETQTIHLKNAWTQDVREATTQMTKTGVYVSTKNDKFLYSRNVPTVDEWLETRCRKIVVIQSYWRRWLAQRRVTQLLKEKRDLERREREIQESLVREKEDLLFHEYMRKTHPKTKSDFDLVYQTIENWKRAQLIKINEAFDGPERKALLCKLHKDECVLLSAAELQKIQAKDGQDRRARDRLLKKVSSPIQFNSCRTGQLTSMETLWITRAKELVALYRALADKRTSISERMEILFSVTVTVSDFVCDLTSEIASLIDREVTILTSGAKTTDHIFDGMRIRLTNLFFEFIKNPIFNPQIARFLPQAPPGGDTENRNLPKMIFCSGCRTYKKIDDFDENSSKKFVEEKKRNFFTKNFGEKTTSCFDCCRLKNLAIDRSDMAFYRKMLEEIRKSELLESHVIDPVIFLMKDFDLKFLLEKIWQISSCVSGRRDLYDLKFVRWDRNAAWNPWNCILLTREEAVVHLRLLNRKVYSEALTQKIELNHERAKILFAKLVKKSQRNLRCIKSKTSLPTLATSEPATVVPV